MLDHPSAQRLARVARALGALRERIVFIGGAVAPLLHTDRQIRNPRPTKDVDGVCATASYAEHGHLQDELRNLGFTEAVGVGGHAHRWSSPQGDLFDLVPAGDVIGATGQEWDLRAAESVETFQLEEHLSIRVPSAPTFVALKLAAFHDRGGSDPLRSDDLEDILALIASRESIVSEIERADPRVRAFVIQQITALSREASLEDFLAAHLNGAMDPASAVNIVRRRLGLITALGISV